MEKPFLKLFSEILDHIDRVQGLQEPLQDGNTRRHLLPGRDRKKTKPFRRGTPPGAHRSSAVAVPVLKEDAEGER